MKVFRLCRENEVRQILDTNSFDNGGNYCRNSEKFHMYIMRILNTCTFLKTNLIYFI